MKSINRCLQGRYQEILIKAAILSCFASTVYVHAQRRETCRISSTLEIEIEGIDMQDEFIVGIELPSFTFDHNSSRDGESPRGNGESPGEISYNFTATDLIIKVRANDQMRLYNWFKETLKRPERMEYKDVKITKIPNEVDGNEYIWVYYNAHPINYKTELKNKRIIETLQIKFKTWERKN